MAECDYLYLTIDLDVFQRQLHRVSAPLRQEALAMKRSRSS